MGLTQSDKQQYKESKKRRKQAYDSYETGKIKPIKNQQKTLITIAIVVVAAVLVIVGGIFLVNSMNGDADSNNVVMGQKLNLSERSKQLLQIVNKRNKLEKDYVPELSDFNGYKVNTAMVDDIAEIHKAAKAKKITLKIKSVYITYDEQQKLYEDTLNRIKQENNYSEVRASAKASRINPEGGCSENQLGLLVDFDVSDVNTKAFLDREGINYGFILRYSEDKASLSHMDASASLYRYVGIENAQKMRSLNMCLEEFVAYNDKTSD